MTFSSRQIKRVAKPEHRLDLISPTSGFVLIAVENSRTMKYFVVLAAVAAALPQPPPPLTINTPCVVQLSLIYGHMVAQCVL
jgi:hypothetical protein